MSVATLAQAQADNSTPRKGRTMQLEKKTLATMIAALIAVSVAVSASIASPPGPNANPHVFTQALNKCASGFAPSPTYHDSQRDYGQSYTCSGPMPQYTCADGFGLVIGSPNGVPPITVSQGGMTMSYHCAQRSSRF